MALLKSGTRIYGYATVDTTLNVDGSDVATSNTTGALKVAGGIGVKGNVFSSGNITAINANLGNIVIANYVTGTLTTSAQPNITSVGTLDSLTVTANISAGNISATDATFTGNLIVSGQAIYANVTTLNIKDSIIEQGGNPNGLALSANAGKDLGSLLHYYTSSPVDAFMGWKTANNEFVVASNVTQNSGVITVIELANIRAGNLIGNVIGSANTVTESSQPNITSVGTLTSLNVTNGVTAAELTGTIKTSAQPNITSLGTLTSLNVAGGANLGSVSNVRILGGTRDYVLKTDGTGNLSWASTGGNANISGNNTEVFFNDSNSNTLGTSSSFTFNSTTNTVTVPNITVTGTLSAGGINYSVNLVPDTNAAYDIGSSAKRWKDLYLSGNIYLGSAQIQSSSNNVIVNNGNIQANYIKGDGSLLTNLPTSSSYVTSNIINLTAGSDIGVSMTYGNTQYPGGVFTIYQMGPVSFTTTDTWVSGGTSKNQYAIFLASSVNTQNINLTLSLSNANFAVRSTDTITIGSTTITGANLTGLGITGTGGTYTIANTLFAGAAQTNSSTAVSANLTTDRGVKTATGSTLTTVAPIAYTLNSITGSFPASTVPYWSLNQSFNWSASITGTTASGNLTFSGGAVSTTSLSSVGGTSGTSSSVDSTSSYTITTNDYFGAGLNGYGSRTIPATVNGTVNAATKYYPIFWKTTGSSAVPAFTTSDSRNSNNYATGQGANTTSTTSNYTWIATPTASTHTWGYTFLGSQVGQDPAVGPSQTTISGYTYTVYGFTNFSAITFLYTVT